MQISYAARIGVHLPFNTEDERRAARKIVEYYEFEYKGSTHSKIDESSYIGTWLQTKPSGEKKEFTANICILMIDILFEKAEQRYGIPRYIEDINLFLRAAYFAADSEQESFWITVTDMMISYSG